MVDIIVLVVIGVLVILAAGYYYYTHHLSEVKPTKISSIGLVADQKWTLSWSAADGTAPIGYVYVIQGVTTPGIVVQGTTFDLSLTLDKTKYVVGRDYQLTLIPKNGAGIGDTVNFLFTPPSPPGVNKIGALFL